MIEKIKALLSEAEKDFIYAKAKIDVYNSVIALMESDTICGMPVNIEETAENTVEPDYSNTVCINAIN